MAATRSPTPLTPSLLKSLWVFAAAACIKLLLVPTYRSTDFDVHRHWLTITHSLPLNQWYTESTAPSCTLDYPPLFAHFSLLLSLPAPLVSPTILTPLPVDRCTLLFLRLTVIFSDLLLLLAAFLFTRGKKGTRSGSYLTLMLVLWSPALLIVDHVHFQYNGFLLAILLLSLYLLEEKKDLMGGILFAALICFKHLFLVAAPVYFVYLLRHYCTGGLVRGLRRLVTMGVAVVAVFVVAFGPFVYYGQVKCGIHVARKIILCLYFLVFVNYGQVLRCDATTLLL